MERIDAQVRAGGKAVRFIAVLLGVLVLDIGTKLLVQKYFFLYQQMDIFGEYVRLTYIYNPGAAFGIHLGDHSRIIFLALSLV
ncbi:MAG: signal peptidase II, partial [Longimicrobiales bacterium]